MTSDFSKTRTRLEKLKENGLAYFAGIENWAEVVYTYERAEADLYWSQLDETRRMTSTELQSELMQAIKIMANCIKRSSLLAEADRRDLGVWTKSIRASLRLRQYHHWEAEVLHDEGTVLGIQQAGQSDATPAHPKQARRNFEQDISNLLGLVDLIAVSPTLVTDEFLVNPQATAEYERDSAFVMMQIDPQNSELEDTYNVVKDCFEHFGITAVRADEIEHESVITEKIRAKIRASEFLMADLTGERPSVYYEIGYAHAL